MADSKPKYGNEFQEIGHCGGQFTVTVNIAADGGRDIKFGIRSSHAPASWFGVYALPQGIPVGTIQMGGIGVAWSPPPSPDCLPIFIGSDSHGMHGHLCPKCDGYWRSDRVPSRWRMTCPYCGIRADTHEFITKGQLTYVAECCEHIVVAIQSQDYGQHVIDMDKIADAVGRTGPRPKFYYAEESQQNKYSCPVCSGSNDILGRYGYCSNCGTHNGLNELAADIGRIRERINSVPNYEACLKETIAAFDSFARQIAKQLASRIPMTPKRRKEWKKKLFHNLRPRAEELKAIFDIDAFRSLPLAEIEFAILMFHRRHVYEHNGGEVDENYIVNSGDNSVRPKQVIRETRETALSTTDVIMKIGDNIHAGFHNIFPPEEMPVRLQRECVERIEKSKSFI